MANTVSKATLYTDVLDGLVRAGLTSQILTANENNIKYNGGGTVEIAKLSMGGYGDYSRSAGYPAGAAVLAWEAHTISQDRGIAFNIDVMDQDETMNTLSTSNLIAEFTKTQSIPEIDSYRYSTIFSKIVDDATVRYSYYTPAVATILTAITDDIADMQDVIGEAEPLTCFISGAAYKYLIGSTELDKSISVQNVTGENGIQTKSYSINGVKLVVVPSARMKTEYAFSATNGFSAKTWAQDINYILMANSAAVAFVKHNKLKVFTADVNQSSDGDLIQARMYHDLWVYENKHDCIYVSLKTATVDAVAGTIAGGTNKVEITITDYVALLAANPGHKWYYLDTDSATAYTVPACYDDLTITSWTEITSAAKVTVTMTATHVCAVVQLDENGRIIEFTQAVSA